MKTGKSEIRFVFLSTLVLEADREIKKNKKIYGSAKLDKLHSTNLIICLNFT